MLYVIKQPNNRMLSVQKMYIFCSFTLCTIILKLNQDPTNVHPTQVYENNTFNKHNIFNPFWRVLNCALYFLGNNYHCRPHISLFLQTYEEIVKDCLWKLEIHDFIMEMTYVLMLSISNSSEILNCTYLSSYLYNHST